jgi:type VI protein secretion system component VasF
VRPDERQTARHRVVRAEPWRRQLLWLLAAALLIGGVTIWFGLGTSVGGWIGTVMVILAAILAAAALLSRARVRRATGATGSGGSRG